MSKLRIIPNPILLPHSYKMYLCTVGKSPAAIYLMDELRKEKEKGNDHFEVLKPITFYCSLLSDLKSMKSKTKIMISNDYFRKTKVKIIESNFPEIIKSLACNVLHSYHNKFLNHEM